MQSRLSPVHNLPVELLSRMFLLGTSLPSSTPFLLKPDDSFAYTPTTSFQILVSHVCSHWRQVALRTSSLWTSLHFREPSHLIRARTFLSRSTSPSARYDILVDTVALKDHIPGITLCRDEFHSIFDIIIPHVPRWHSFSLKIRDNECKAGARRRLSTCGPAPSLETLQLYHWEEWGTSQNLYLATVRPPVVVFGGEIPLLKNVSLIGVNLPWEHCAQFLCGLQNLELALHSEAVRPSYEQWERMLRSSPGLEELSLHYSGPRIPGGLLSPTTGGTSMDPSWPQSRSPIHLPNLRELSLTDLDPEYLCLLFEHLSIPGVRTLALDLPEQDFTPFVAMIAGIGKDAGTKEAKGGGFFGGLQVLIVTALECNATSWSALMGSVPDLARLEVDFGRVGEALYGVLIGESNQNSCDHKVILPHLTSIKISRLSGIKVKALIGYREKVGAVVEKWSVRWCAAWKGRDGILDELVECGWIGDGGKDSGGRKVKVEAFLEDDDDDDEDEEEEGEGSPNEI